MEKSNLISLEELSENAGIVLVDACAFFTIYQKPYFVCKTFSEKLDWKFNEAHSIDFWRENLKSLKNIYITLEIFNEIKQRDNYPIRTPYKSEYENNLLLKEFGKQLIKCSQKREHLLGVLKEEKKVIDINSEDLSIYMDLKSQYSYLKDKKNFPIDESKLRFLILGAVFSRKERVYFISNNARLMFAWKDFLRGEDLSKRHLGFYLRKSHNGFSEAY